MRNRSIWSDATVFLKKDKHIAPLIKKWGICTIKPISKKNYFEDLVDAICSQQLSGKAAKTIFERVKKLLVNVSPEFILVQSDRNLRDCGLSWQKVSYIKDLASKTSSGELRVTGLNKLSDEMVITELIKVKGIGRWTAEMFLMFCLARPDIFPVDDLGINKAIDTIVNKATSKVDKLKFSERWRPYRTVASWYLWRSLENR